MTGADTDLHTHLREATREEHAALDRHPCLRPLAAGPLTRAAYARALAALHGPQQALEAAVTAALDELAMDYPFAARAGALAQDLRHIGLAARPLAAEPPRFRSPEEVVGGLYVLEGSRLGGGAIRKRVRHSLGSDAPAGFFETAEVSDWKDFLRFARHACPPAAEEEATAAARASFRLFRRHLDALEPTG